MPDSQSFRVAVVTPYCHETPTILRTCCESVTAQTYPCTHFLVADGYPQDVPNSSHVEHILLPRAHGDNGNTARCIGSLSAMNQGFDAIAYLDADNWYYPQHIESMVSLHAKSSADVCTAQRSMHRVDGSLMYHDQDESNGTSHVDTSCLFLTRPAFSILPTWAMMPFQFGPICDRIIWATIKRHGFSTAHHSTTTVAFRTQYQVHYQRLGEIPPPETKTIEESTGSAFEWFFSLPPEVQAKWTKTLGLGIARH